MKFGKQLEVNELPKYRGNYIQYKELKSALKVFTGQDKDAATVEEVTHWASSFLRLGPNPELTPEARLQEVLTRELERVSKFADLEQAALRTQLSSLLQDCQKDTVPRATLQTRLDEVGEDIASLKSFTRMNFTAFRKILKKYDKWSKTTVMPWYMAQVMRAPLMNIDFEGLLQSLNQIAVSLRSQARSAGTQRRMSRSISLDDLGPPRGSREVVFLVDPKDAMQVRVQLAKSMKFAAPPLRAGSKQRLRTSAVYLDAPDLSTYSAHIVGAPTRDDTTTDQPNCTSFHIRTAEASMVASAVYEEAGSRADILMSKEEVSKLMRGDVAAVLAVSPLATPVAGAVPFASKETAVESVKKARALLKKEPRLAPLAQASYLRSILQDEDGFVATFDEDVRFNAVKGDWDSGSVNPVEYFPFSVLSITYPRLMNADDAPRWLRTIYDSGNLIQVCCFSKAAHALARFHALALGLPPPQWYHSVLSSGSGGAENEIERERSGEQADAKGSSKDGGDLATAPSVITDEAQQVEEVFASAGGASSSAAKDFKARGRMWTLNSVRLLHEFGTTPEVEEEMLASRQTAIARGDSFAVPAPDGGGLDAPLLSGGQVQSEEVPVSRSKLQRLWGRLTGRASDSQKELAVRRAIVAVQPKTLYSNERTFLEWIHFATLTASVGVLMLHVTGEAAHVQIGRLLIFASIFIIVWSMHVFNWRADGLDNKAIIDYHDHVGPVALMLSLFGALIFTSFHAVGLIS